MKALGEEERELWIAPKAYAEEIKWSVLNSSDKKELLKTLQWDIDFIGITGNCRALLSYPCFIDLLAHQNGSLFKSGTLVNARCSTFKKMLQFGTLGSFQVGLPLVDSELEEDTEQPLAGFCEDNQELAWRCSRLKHLRDIVAAKGKLAQSGILPSRQVLAFIEEHFSNEIICFIRYGQKQILDSVSSELEALSSAFTVDVALAFECTLPGSFVGCHSASCSVAHAFSILGSKLACNLINNAPVLESAYRVVCYNTVQHTRRSYQYKVGVSRATGTIASQLAKCIDSVLVDIHDKLIPCFANTSFRNEVYFALQSTNFKKLKKATLKFFLDDVELVAAMDSDVCTYIQYITGAALHATRNLIEDSFEDLYLLLELFYQAVQRIFCLTRINKSFSEIASCYGVSHNAFQIEHIKINVSYFIDQIRSFAKYATLLTDKDQPTDLLLTSLLLHECLNREIASETLSEIVSACAALVFRYCKSWLTSEIDSRSQITEASIQQLLELFSKKSKKNLPGFCISNVLKFAETNENIFRLVIGDLRKTRLSCKQGLVVLTYEPNGNVVETSTLLQIVQSQTFDQVSLAFGKALAAARQLNEPTIAMLLKLYETCLDEARTISYRNDIENYADSDAFIRCIFATVIVETGCQTKDNSLSAMTIKRRRKYNVSKSCETEAKYIFEVCNRPKMFVRFVAIVFVYMHGYQTNDSESKRLMAKHKDNLTSQLARMYSFVKTSHLLYATCIFEMKTKQGNVPIHECQRIELVGMVSPQSRSSLQKERITSSSNVDPNRKLQLAHKLWQSRKFDATKLEDWIFEAPDIVELNLPNVSPIIKHSPHLTASTNKSVSEVRPILSNLNHDHSHNLDNLNLEVLNLIKEQDWISLEHLSSMETFVNFLHSELGYDEANYLSKLEQKTDSEVIRKILVVLKRKWLCMEAWLDAIFNSAKLNATEEAEHVIAQPILTPESMIAEDEKSTQAMDNNRGDIYFGDRVQTDAVLGQYSEKINLLLLTVNDVLEFDDRSLNDALSQLLHFNELTCRIIVKRLKQIAIQISTNL